MSICVASPRYLCVDTSLDPDQWSSVASELGVLGLEQARSHNRKFELSSGMPSQAYVRGAETLYQLGGQGADVTISLVKLQFLWQIHERLNHHLVPWARSLIVGDTGGVIAPRPIFHVHLQVRIGGFQFPPTRRLPIGRHFESFRGASDSVTGKQRKNRMHRQWRRFQKWRAHLKAIEVVVVVVKHRNIQIEVGTTRVRYPAS
jgi:hypothetical protein